MNDIIGIPQRDIAASLLHAVSLAELLRECHLCRPFHGCINSLTLGIDPQGRSVVLADLMASTEINQQLAYMAPEQARQLQTELDTRSDLYSLGVVIYTFLTGQLPFDRADPAELVHCHIAVSPVPPKEIRHELPQALSNIVLKLLSKHPDDRYQSTSGLIADLEFCIIALEANGHIPEFPLGLYDFKGKLLAPSKLFGRDTELQRIYQCYSHVSNGQKQLLMVAGPSGTGKSSLVKEIIPAVEATGGIFLTGKFDQYKRNVPYATLVQAFQEFVPKLLSGTDAVIEEWRVAIQDAVGNHCRLIVDVIPELRHILGTIPPSIVALDPSGAENRFLTVFRRFVSVFATARHPLVLFLDDLQWIDAGSQKLIIDLATHTDLHHLMIIGAYRDDEVNNDHHLTQCIHKIRHHNGVVDEIKLGALSYDDSCRLIAHVLGCPSENISALTSTLHAKVGGNPFFIAQSLAALSDNGILRFDLQARCWQWDIRQVEAFQLTDNVIELMAEALRRLPEPCVELIKTLACLGITSQLSTLQNITGHDALHLGRLLDVLEQSGLIRRAKEQALFAHDRMHEAAYSMMSKAEQQLRHLEIGRRLLAETLPSEIEQCAFDLAYHFNRGFERIAVQSEKHAVFQINRVAGRRARESAAFQAARDYLNHAISQISFGAWTDLYTDTFDLYLDCAECETVLGNFECAESLLDQAQAHAKTRYDQARIARIRIRLYYFSTRGDDCIAAGLEILSQFGVHFPSADADLDAYAESNRQLIDTHISQAGINSLVELPIATSRDAKLTIGMLADLLTVAYSARPTIALPFLVKGIQLCLEHGNVEESCVLYNHYGLFLAGRYGAVETGYAYADIARRLNARHNDPTLRGRVLFVFGYAFAPLRQPFVECLPILEEAFTACNDVGQVGFAGASIDAFIWMAMESGMPLSKIKELAAPYRDFSQNSNTFKANCVIAVLELMIEDLQGQPYREIENGILERLGGVGWHYTFGHYHISRQIRHYLYGEYEKAADAAQSAKVMPPSLHALTSMVTHHFYHALTLAALYDEAGKEQKTALHELLKVEFATLNNWAQCHPENYGCRAKLVEAEIARIEGRADLAAVLFDQSVMSARSSGQLHYEALASELTGRFYLSLGTAMTAHAHFFVARACWRRWGATGKAAQLEKSVATLEPEFEASPSENRMDTAYLPDFDALAVAKASQAVSSEIELGKLTQSLLRTVLEHAGADRGVLILSSGSEARIEAEAEVSQGNIKVKLRRQPVTDISVPRTMVQYVTRTYEKLILDDATRPHPYAADVYFNSCQPKSVLCLPLLKQSKLVGVMYLENRLAPKVFTRGRIAMLELLASQAVISLENAYLYSEVEKENSERKRAEGALQTKTQELESQAAFMNAVVENIPVAVYVKDVHNELRYSLWNKAAEEIFKIPKNAALGKTAREIWLLNTAKYIEATDAEIITSKKRIDNPLQQFQVTDQHTLLLNTIKLPLTNGSNENVDYVLGISDDITERKRSELLIWQQANFDSLTGLPNRTYFRDQLAQAITRCSAASDEFAVLFIDLDRFKEVNDTLGHASGDILLVAAARRISDCVRETDTVARLGGDEFTVVLSKIDYPGHIEDISQRIIHALAVPFQIGHDQAFISASIGITVYPYDATEIDGLLKSADQALYIAKDSGRNQYGYFTPAMQAAAVHRTRLTADLRGAIERNELQIHFQPIVTLPTGQVEKAEALIRWEHPHLGFIDPAEFIPLAESSGLILQIGDWVFHKISQTLKKWRSTYHPSFQISINQSPLEFQRQNNRYLQWIEHLKALDIPGEAIILEITEGLLLDATEKVITTLSNLRHAGIQVALDDFGTGYSSLAYLQKFDIDYLKIDRAFTQNLFVGSDNLALCKAMIMMAHTLGLKVIAEGIESKEQQILLRTAGCDYSQGFLFSHPLKETEFDALLDRTLPSALPIERDEGR